MITEAELISTGIKAMTETGAFTLSFGQEAGRGTLLIAIAGADPLKVPLSVAALDHLSDEAARCRRSVLLARTTDGTEPVVPRRSSAA